MMDFARIALLLHVEEAARKHPQLKAIVEAAMEELGQHARGEITYEEYQEHHDAA